MTQIGIIGLGKMGSAIAQRFAAQGHSVLGWTRSGHSVDGIETTKNIETLVESCDTLILSLFDDLAVKSVIDRLLELDLTNKQIIETSTVMPAILTDRMERITSAGCMAVDAPISGGPEMVQAGICGVFIGGDDNAAARARDCLTAISNRIFHVGPLGAGLVMKVINNGMMQAYTSGLVELMPLAKQAGLPLETVLQILSGGPAGLPMMTARIDKILGKDKEVGVTVNAVFKDNDVFQRVVGSYGLKATVLKNFGNLKGDALAENLGEQDVAALTRLAYFGPGDG